MFDIGPSELLLVVIVAIVVIGPKDLPRALYKAGQVIGKARGMARHFRSGIDAMIREAELEELQKQWDKENARIMAEHPVAASVMTEKPLVDGSAETAALPAPEESAASDSETAPAAEAPEAAASEPMPPETSKGAASS